ncbi:MAG: O-antigen ligase family protein [Phycisphaerae bacterium]
MAQRFRVIEFAWQRVVSLLILVLIGACAFGVALKVGQPTAKKTALVLMAGAVPFAAVVTRRPKAVLLFAWLFSLTYSRMYYSLDRVLGNHGSQGFYWIPADIFFAGLLGIWAYQAVVLKQRSAPLGRASWPWLLPFFAACVLSTLASERMSWGFFELLRLVKVGLVIWYVRCNVRREEWWVCIAALGCAMLAQSGLAITQVALKRVGGVLSMFGIGQAADAAFQAAGQAAVGGWIRGQGTIGHPSNLACYLLLPVPVFLALGVTLRSKPVRLLCGVCGLIGLAGLACTLSRWPWVLAAVQTGALAVGLVWFCKARAQRIIGLLSVGAFLAAVALLPFTNFIYERITRDLSESLDFRAKQNRTVFALATRFPMLGVGLNNYKLYLLEYEPELEWALSKEDEVRMGLARRVFVVPHNLYFYLLAETGAIGVSMFAVLLVGVLYTGARAVSATDGPWRAVCLALLLGIAAVLAQQVVDFSLWVDPVLYTFALIIGLLSVAPALSGAASAGSRHAALGDTPNV